MKRFAFFLPLLLPSLMFAQTSEFTSGDEGWRASGDPVSTIPNWYPAGGNPGGHIRVVDASTGGTWYFVAPAAFRGQKCGSYGQFLRYDAYTVDTTDQQLYASKPDVIIAGSGLQLIFNNPNNPGVDWTHYDILLREDAGWRLGSLTGPVPTQAQFRAVLGSVTSLRIRGEYRTQEDEGGLDNVVLESGFHFDLDGDDSSGAPGADFRADTICSAYGLIADLDALLQSESVIDSVVVRVVSPGATDELRLDAVLGNVVIQKPSASQVAFLNDGTTLAADFLLCLHLVDYFDHAPSPARGTRLIEVRIYTACGLTGTATAFLPVYPPPNAGRDGDTLLCAGSPRLDLRALVGPDAEPGGQWLPPLAGGGSEFDPARDAAGTYRYAFPPAGVCPGDTATVAVAVEPAFQLHGDTTLCNEDTLQLRVPSNLLVWTWSPGGSRSVLTVDAPGTYRLAGSTAHCTFTDSVTVAFYSCHPCPYYAPNVFSPNDDGDNDDWSIQLPCESTTYHLQIFDRWGSLVFEAKDSQTAWDGRWRGKAVDPGVYLWRLEWTGELFGKPQLFREKGDLTIVR